MQEADSISLQWQTSQEIGTAGFYLHRAMGGNDFFAPITPLLPSLGAQGGRYQFIDETVQPGQEYAYMLVEEKQDGSRIEYRSLITVVGTGTNETYQLFLPLVNK